jgi:hypothetical protein
MSKLFVPNDWAGMRVPTQPRVPAVFSAQARHHPRWAGRPVCEPGSYRYCFQRFMGPLQVESRGAENRESVWRAPDPRHRRDRHALAV